MTASEMICLTCNVLGPLTHPVRPYPCLFNISACGFNAVFRTA